MPEDASDISAAALGQVGLAAWMSLSWRAPVRPGEVVLVLGATGSVGSVAVQAAKLLGAGRVIAAGRDAARLEAASALGADATVSLEGDDVRERLAAAAGGRRRRSCSTRSTGRRSKRRSASSARGRASSTSVSRPRRRSRSRRGSCAASSSSCSGYSNFAVPLDVLAQGYKDVVGARGRRPHPPRRRSGAARSRRRGVGAPGAGPRRQARPRSVTGGLDVSAQPRRRR